MSESRWTPPWIALTVATNGAFVGYMIYSYLKGRAGDTAYATTYNLFRHPSWLNFKRWWAHMANDPWTEIGLMFVFMLAPLPLLPYHLHERIELMVAKLGIYTIMSSAILGGPNYDPEEPYGGETKSAYTAKWIFIGVILMLVTGSYVCKRTGICTAP